MRLLLCLSKCTRCLSLLHRINGARATPAHATAHSHSRQPNPHQHKTTATERARRWLKLELEATTLLAFLLTRHGAGDAAFDQPGLRALRRAGLAAKRQRPGGRASGGGGGASGNGASGGGRGAGEEDDARDAEALAAAAAEQALADMTDLRLRLGLDAALGAQLKARGGVRKSRRVRGRAALGDGEEEWADEGERGEVAMY